ncbi:MraY family glycosyltransferase [Amnibacterium sp.]|uniref:MraY family glycosyltransferase n=1 Tax=Amnibacterium sp. TaxID=1872496 RepID=UPI0026390415|nr:MraY family glycosyltransferase [Amnibacterium sp.]MCU1475044.1 putative glycosyl transferase [Amnibacterium sp.]
MIVTLLVALCAAVVTFLMSLVMWRVGVKYKLYPKIRERDVHTTPTPRLGGIAMFCGVLAALLLASQIPFFHIVFANQKQIVAVLLAATLIVVIGVLDDFFDLDWSTKLIGQVLAAGLLAWLGGLQIDSLPVGGVFGIFVGSTWASLALTLFIVVAVMNMLNFIDGLDGLVAGVGVIANGTFYLYSYMLIRLVDQTNYFNLASLISAIVLGACLGFLPLNWHPAKLFMGDAGALLVGLLMSVSAISVTGSIDPAQLFPGNRAAFAPAFLPLLLPFAILIVPMLDFSLAVVRRLAAGKSPFSADRKHLHHRLLDMGHTRFHATLIFYAWTAVISVGSLLFFVARPYWLAWIFMGGGLLLCAAATLAPLSHRKRREYEVQREPVATTTTEIAVLDPLDKATNTTPVQGRHA